MVEVTPEFIRIRKVELRAGKRHLIAGKLKKAEKTPSTSPNNGDAIGSSPFSSVSK